MPLLPENCCCCINLETGAKYVAWTGIFLSAGFFVCNGILLNEFPFVSPDLVVGVIVFGAGAGIFANCLLLLGLSNSIRQLLIVWLLTHVLQTAAAATLTVFWARSSLEGPQHHLEMRIIMTVFACFVSVMFLHFWFVVLARYRSMGNEKKYLANILLKNEQKAMKKQKTGLEQIPAEQIIPQYARDPSSEIEAQLW